MSSKSGRKSVFKKGSAAMSTKQRQRVSVFSNALDDGDLFTDIIVAEEPVDPYKDLRYEEPPPQIIVCRSVSGSLRPERPVSVRRMRTTPLKRKTPPIDPSSLRIMLPTGKTEGTLEVYSRETSMVKRKTDALEMEVARDPSTQGLREKALVAQRASLRTWAREHELGSTLGKHLSGKLGEPPEALLLNRTLPLPPLQNHRDPSLGPECDFPQWTRPWWERTHGSDAFFLPPVHMGPEDDGLVLTYAWSERQLYKPPLSIVKPQLGEEPLFRDRKKPVQTADADQELMGLYLQGEALRTEDNVIPEPDVAEKSSIHSVASAYPLKASCSSSWKWDSWVCGPRLESPYFVRNVVPALKLDRFTYVWGHPCLKGIVEIGVVCNAGEKGWTQIRLANVGCCTVRYSWRHLPHVDHFNTGRHRRSPFIFNCSGGILLPEEKISLPVQFLSPYAGSWTERWFVQTTPCLGPQGRREIPVTLWGMALEVDVISQERVRLDKELESSAVLRMSENDTRDLVRLLPVRSRESLLRQHVPPIPEWRGQDDVQAFMSANPGLHYHSTAMLSLLFAHRDLQQEKGWIAPPRQGHVMEISSAKGQPISGVNPESMGVNVPKKNRPDSRGAQGPGGGAPVGGNKGVKRNRSHMTVSSGSKLSMGINASKERVRSMSLHGGQGPRRLSEENSDSSICLPLTVDHFSQPRADICVCELHREAQKLHEDSDKKQEILKNINQAILAMSLKPFVPPMRHYKHVILRQALVQLFDQIAASEWKIRCDLGLLQNMSFEKLASFPQNLPGPTRDMKQKINSKAGLSTTNASRARRITHVVSTVANPAISELLDTPEEDPLPVEPIDWEQSLPCQYRDKLKSVIYTRLASTLESLLPIINHDGYRMNPLLPASEI